jgi:chromosome segregation ATPase
MPTRAVERLRLDGNPPPAPHDIATATGADDAHRHALRLVDPASLVGRQSAFIDSDFVGLIDQLQGAGQHVRQLEERIKNFQQAHEARERSLEELKLAMDRASRAEARAHEADARAAAQTKILEERLIAAEERACKAEQWLAYIKQAIRNEFRDVPM